MVARRVRTIRFLDYEWRTVVQLAAEARQKPAEYLREKSLSVAIARAGGCQPKSRRVPDSR